MNKEMAKGLQGVLVHLDAAYLETGLGMMDLKKVLQGDRIHDLHKKAGENLDKKLLAAAAELLTVRIDIRDSLSDSGYDPFPH